MLSLLNGISPIWWLAFALILGAIEMLVPSTFLLWPALAAIAMAIALVIWPDLSGEIQVLSFALLSLVAILAGRWAISRWKSNDSVDLKLNDPPARMVGRVAEVVSFEGPGGSVVIDGTVWQARWDPGEKASPGEKVRVRDSKGSTLLVE